ncbi:MAG: hypothetical protein BWY93_02074 [Euryarchaeota archaeon ADurb.BinA087]|nr:MAG: hypothetical protein BWY93_02074 [Euryarchaeota archaeon ADurb.BinA087]
MLPYLTAVRNRHCDGWNRCTECERCITGVSIYRIAGAGDPDQVVIARRQSGGDHPTVRSSPRCPNGGTQGDRCYGSTSDRLDKYGSSRIANIGPLDGLEGALLPDLTAVRNRHSYGWNRTDRERRITGVSIYRIAGAGNPDQVVITRWQSGGYRPAVGSNSHCSNRGTQGDRCYGSTSDRLDKYGSSRIASVGPLDGLEGALLPYLTAVRNRHRDGWNRFLVGSHIRPCRVNRLRGEPDSRRSIYSGVTDDIIGLHPVVIGLACNDAVVSVCRGVHAQRECRNAQGKSYIISPLEGKSCFIQGIIYPRQVNYRAVYGSHQVGGCIWLRRKEQGMHHVHLFVGEDVAVEDVLPPEVDDVVQHLYRFTGRVEPGIPTTRR